jgi:hypothetical protein
MRPNMDAEIVVLQAVLANAKDEHQLKAGLAHAIELLEENVPYAVKIEGLLRETRRFLEFYPVPYKANELLQRIDAALAKNLSTPLAVSAETPRSRSPGTTGADTLAAGGTNSRDALTGLLNPSDTDGPLYRAIRYLAAIKVMRPLHSGVADSVGPIELTTADLSALTDKLVTLYRDAEPEVHARSL